MAASTRFGTNSTSDDECIPEARVSLLLRLLLLLQVNSVVVAGHDTTSFCLTSTLYWVSQTPAAQQKLLAELDAFGRHRRVTAADMDKLPYLEVSHDPGSGVQ